MYLEQDKTYLVDFGKEIEYLKGSEIDEYRVFGPVRVFDGDTLLGCLEELPFSAVYP